MWCGLECRIRIVDSSASSLLGQVREASLDFFHRSQAARRPAVGKADRVLPQAGTSESGCSA